MSEGLYNVNIATRDQKIMGFDVWRKLPLSKLDDAYLIAALRRMEALVPEGLNHENLEVGYVENVEDVADPEGVENYEVFKLEAETRGLTWRVV